MNRFASLFSNPRILNDSRPGLGGLQGFTTNPLGDLVTPAQVLMYQAAYEKAQMGLKEREWWPTAECWN